MGDMAFGIAEKDEHGRYKIRIKDEYLFLLEGDLEKILAIVQHMLDADEPLLTIVGRWELNGLKQILEDKIDGRT